MRYWIIPSLLWMLFSCGQELEEPVKFHGEYEVTNRNFIDDSLIWKANSTYLAEVWLDGTICNWKKRFLHQEFDDNLQPTYYLADSLELSLQLDTNFSIQKVRNWDAIYGKLEKYIDKMEADAPEDRKAMLRAFASEVSLDSALIVQKNTRDVELLNSAWRYLYLGKNDGYSIKKEGSFHTLTSEQPLDEALRTELGSWINKVSGMLEVDASTQDPEGMIAITIMVDTEEKLVYHLKLELTIVDEWGEKITQLTELKWLGD